MTSTVRVSSVLEKPFPQRRRSTGQLHALIPPGADSPPDNIRRGSGELSGDNLRTIHENSPGLQTKNCVTSLKDSIRVHRRTSGVGSRASFEARHKQYRSSWAYDTTDSAAAVDTSVCAHAPQDIRASREKSRSTFTLYSEKFGESNGPCERSAVERSRSTLTLLGADRAAQLSYDAPGRPHFRTGSRRSLQLPPDFSRETRRVPEVAEDVSYLDGIERETTIEEELERDVVKLEAYLCIWRERYMRARTANARLRKTVKDLRSTHDQRVCRLNEKLFALTKENDQLKRRNSELVTACSLVLDRNKQERRRHEQQMRDVTTEVKRMRTQCKEAEDRLTEYQAEVRESEGRRENGVNDVDMTTQCYETLLDIALERIKFLEQEYERAASEEPQRSHVEGAAVVATECKKITRSISAMIHSDNDDDDADETRARSPLPAVVMRSFRRGRRGVSTNSTSSARPTLVVSGAGSPDAAASSTNGTDDSRPQFSLHDDVDDNASVNSVDSVLSTLITRLQETAAAATDSTDRLSTTSGMSPEFAFRRCHSVIERRPESPSDADSVSMAGYKEAPPTGRQTPDPESEATGHSASGFAVLRQRRNGIVNIKFPTESKQKKGKAREFTDAIRRFTISAKSRDCEKKRTSIHSVFKTLSS